MEGSQLSHQSPPESQPVPPPSFRVPPEGKRWPTWLRVLVPLLLLLLGVGLAAALVLSKPAVEKKAKPQAALPVEVVPIAVGDHSMVLRAQGTVRAARQVVLQPEITGRVTWLSDELVPGGKLERGQPLVRINPRDYQLALKQSQAQVANQALSLRMEKARQGVAAREWEIYQAEREERERSRGRGKSARASSPPRDEPKADAGAPTPDDVLKEGDLALREPQVKSAEIALQSARSGLSQARLQLSRTSLVAPFNAFVQAEAVDLGQLVSPASQLATLVGTDTYWVQVSLPVDQLGYVVLPTGDRAGSAARVWFEAGEERVERVGKVIRLLGDLDPVGRMARVMVEIDDPLGMDDEGGDQPRGAKAAAAAPPPAGVPQSGDGLDNGSSKLPLLLGSFVNVEIRGKTLHNVAEIPTRALQANDRVYLMSADGKLEIRTVKVLLRSATTTTVRGELSGGEKLIVTPIDAAVEGMALRILTAEPTAAAPSASAVPTASAAASSPNGATPSASPTSSTGASP